MLKKVLKKESKQKVNDRHITCNVCLDKITQKGKRKSDERAGVFALTTKKESQIIFMCHHCSTNVLLYVEDLAGEFAHIQKTQKKGCVK